VAYSTDVLALNPVLYWRLGEGAGTTAADETANNSDGTYSNVVLSATGCLTGDADTAVKFDDHNDSKAQASAVTALPTGVGDDWSIVLWHRTRSLVSLSQYFGFGHGPLPTNPDEGKGRHVLCFNSNYYFWAQNQDWDTGVAFDADSAPHMIAFTSDGSFLRLYVDGALAAGPQAIPYNATAGTFVTAGSHHSVGASPNADIDECAIFDFDLSAGEISDLYDSGTGGGGATKRRYTLTTLGVG
jgi:hypothetical protein